MTRIITLISSTLIEIAAAFRPLVSPKFAVVKSTATRDAGARRLAALRARGLI